LLLAAAAEERGGRGGEKGKIRRAMPLDSSLNEKKGGGKRRGRGREIPRTARFAKYDWPKGKKKKKRRRRGGGRRKDAKSCFSILTSILFEREGGEKGKEEGEGCTRGKSLRSSSFWRLEKPNGRGEKGRGGEGEKRKKVPSIKPIDSPKKEGGREREGKKSSIIFVRSNGKGEKKRKRRPLRRDETERKKGGKKQSKLL